MVTLTALPWWVLLPLSLAVVFGLTMALRAVLGRVVGEDPQPAIGLAAPLMTAFGALFAFISAFVIATEWGTLAQADASVAAEARASARLAWASTADGIDTAAVQGSLSSYLDEAVSVEWSAMADGEAVAADTSSEWQALERTVRRQLERPDVDTAEASEVLGALDDLAAARRGRLDLAAHTLPLPLFVILGLSGLALCANAAVLTLPHAPRATVVAWSIVLVVALDLGLVLVLGGPFRGSSVTAPDHLAEVDLALRAGFFTL
jgi:hypothetical protein